MRSRVLIEKCWSSQGIFRIRLSCSIAQLRNFPRQWWYLRKLSVTIVMSMQELWITWRWGLGAYELSSLDMVSQLGKCVHLYLWWSCKLWYPLWRYQVKNLLPTLKAIVLASSRTLGRITGTLVGDWIARQNDLRHFAGQKYDRMKWIRHVHTPWLTAPDVFCVSMNGLSNLTIAGFSCTGWMSDLIWIRLMLRGHISKGSICCRICAFAPTFGPTWSCTNTHRRVHDQWTMLLPGGPTSKELYL